MDDQFPPKGFHLVPSMIDGIEIFAPDLPEDDPLQEIIDFKCPQCGATTAYSASDGGLTCTHCGYYDAPEKSVVGQRAKEFEFTLESLERAAQGWGEQRTELSCQNCGAITSISISNLTHTCPFCGSNQVIHRPAAQDGLRPLFLIPFKIEPTTCNTIVKNWISNSWMTPSSLKNLAALGKFTGVYLPFWTFDAHTHALWKAEVGHQETERYHDNGEWKTRVVTRWRWESGQVKLWIDDLVVRGTERLSPRLLGEIQDFNLSELAPYEPKYLAGFSAKSYDIPLEKAWELGRQEMRERTREACMNQASTSLIRNFSMTLDFSDEQWRYVLFPVYLAAYRYQDQTYQVMINGQSGKISGQRPADWNKIWLVVAALLSPGLFIGFIGLLSIPLAGAGIGIGAIGFLLLVIGVMISVMIYQKAQALDDL